MQGDKIPQQEFALKMQGGGEGGGLCASGGVFAGHFGIYLSSCRQNKSGSGVTLERAWEQA